MQFTVGHFYAACFVLFYVLSFVFMYRKFSEIIAFFILFIVHTSCFIYMAKDVYAYLTKGYSFIPMFLASVLFTIAAFEFVAIAFVLQLILTLRKKYTIDKGTPIYLSQNYQTKLDEFKAITIILFAMGFCILCTLTFGIRSIDINFSDVMNNLTMDVFTKHIGLFGLILFGSISIGLAGYQVYVGNELSYAQYNKIIK